MDDLLREFLTESNENLERLDQEIVELERRPTDKSLLNSIFRTIHTIKGTCGFIGLERLEMVAHSAEGALSRLRDGEIQSSPRLINDILAAIDVIKEILDSLNRTEMEPEGDDSALIARLDAWLEDNGSVAEAVKINDVHVAIEAVMHAARMSGNHAAIGSVRMSGNHAAFNTKPNGSCVVGSVQGIAVTGNRIAGSEVAGNTMGANAVNDGVQSVNAKNALKADVVIEQKNEVKAELNADLADSSLRVNVQLLDKLMNLVGELVLGRNQLIQLASLDESSVFAKPVQHLNRVATDLQEAVMRTRMQPIGTSWSKIPRLVRDLSQASGKTISLEMHGQDTELDRQILQAIQDPLTHMIRNSADHGIELPEVRRAAGKSERGTIQLNAFHEGGHVILEITDDGAGIDVNRVRQKAIERGLVKADAVSGLTDAQILRFIFEPGFSTAEKITNVSGRGVGMDVVRSSIEKIGGTVELASKKGKGSTVKIKIPLTLAIVSALLVGVANEVFAIPQIGVIELVRVTEEQREKIEVLHGSRYFRLRDSLLPLVSLTRTLNLDSIGDAADYNIVVCQLGDAKFGLMVDEVFDTQEIVVKPVGRLVKHLTTYAGCTILGDGRVIMILDTTGVANASLELTAANEVQSTSRQLALREETATQHLESVLLFDGGYEAQQAVPLSLVARLEEIPSEQISFADGRFLVEYRGGLLPLVPVNPDMDMRAKPMRPVLVFSEGDRSMGLAVEEIKDIVQEQLHVDGDVHRTGVLGVCTIAGKISEILDTDYFLRKAHPNWFTPSSAKDTSKTRVLLVDDSRFFIELLGPLMRANNAQVVTAYDGREALDHLEKGELFDVVISDIEMGNVDGLTLARSIRANPSWREQKLIALTARGGEDHRAAAMGAGFDDFITKTNRTALITAIGQLMNSGEVMVS